MVLDILIAEDEPAILESLEFILQRKGWSVAAVHDGEAALEALVRLQPRLLLLDIMLPRKNGMDVLKTIRAQPDLYQANVLVLTARGQRYDRKMASDLNADGFITKPYSNSEVIAEVSRLLSTPQIVAS
ncbi:DNA-binding response OmpR family regulator [Paenochrobactrum gallinarii]|uniref:Polar-differentiation response regulator DivK n=1 Tax=Paenochrobactrum gallinarii TaxID=643673 RepID=A0A841LTL4_9HYPH|nr:DNA-binding response OmpR family regulator [Paenochrobactrum gallinarii]